MIASQKAVSSSPRHVTNYGLGAFSVHAVLLNIHNFLGIQYDEISNLPSWVLSLMLRETLA